jgi:hypothetical protein
MLAGREAVHAAALASEERRSDSGRLVWGEVLDNA